MMTLQYRPNETTLELGASDKSATQEIDDTKERSSDSVVYQGKHMQGRH